MSPVLSQGKVVVLTGAASGIGLHLAKRFLAEQWRLVALDVRYDALQTALGGMADKQRLMLLAMDVRHPAAWDAMLDQVEGHFGVPDVMINNAGIIVPGRIQNATPELIDRHIDINLKGVLYSTSLVAARMIRAGVKGHIINVASMAALAPVPGIGAYSASKFGVRAYSLVANQELAEHGIAVTCVCPDLVDTPMLDTQLDYPEASITFSGPGALSVSRIGAAIFSALKTRPAECIVPAHRGWLAKMASMFPVLMRPLKRSMEAKGQRRAEQYKRERRG
ncbi:MAG: SDR family NAD(P)-dependent oxidoreductase [Bacteroidetes bacterium]|nr:SDR family NAD(P)-dependent oxidoreductase [Bacteroidota bacterium]